MSAPQSETTDLKTADLVDEIKNLERLYGLTPVLNGLCEIFDERASLMRKVANFHASISDIVEVEGRPGPVAVRQAAPVQTFMGGKKKMVILPDETVLAIRNWANDNKHVPTAELAREAAAEHGCTEATATGIINGTARINVGGPMRKVKAKKAGK